MAATLAFCGWLLWTARPDPATPAGIGGLIGYTVSMFGLCMVFGLLLSSASWKCCKRSQRAAMVGFTLGAGGIFGLVTAGNARVSQYRPQPHLSVSLAQAQQAGLPADSQSQSHAIPAYDTSRFDIWDEVGLEMTLEGKFPKVNDEERLKLARAYLQGTMPPKIVVLYEEAIRTGRVPDPRTDWKEPTRLDRFYRVSELLNAPPSEQPAREKAPAVEPAVPPYYISRLKAVAQMDADGTLRAEIQNGVGHVFSTVAVELTVKNADGSTAEVKRFFANVTSASGRQAFTIAHAGPIPPGQTFAWRIASATGHRVPHNAPMQN